MLVQDTLPLSLQNVAGQGDVADTPWVIGGGSLRSVAMRGLHGAPVFLAIILVVAVVGCSVSAWSGELLILAGGDTILAGSDINEYNPATGGLTLTAEGSLRWSKWEHSKIVGDREIPMLSELTGQMFRLEISGELVFEGHFSSRASSKLYDGFVLYDSLILSGDSNLRLVYEQLPDSVQSANPCESNVFLEYFRARGKLVEGE